MEELKEHSLIGRVGNDPLQIRPVHDDPLYIGDEESCRVVKDLAIGPLPGRL